MPWAPGPLVFTSSYHSYDTFAYGWPGPASCCYLMRTALTFKERLSGGVVGGWGQAGIGGYIYIGLASCQPIMDLRNLQKLKEGGPWPLIPEFPKLQ